jgi:hypothetical protein
MGWFLLSCHIVIWQLSRNILNRVITRIYSHTFKKYITLLKTKLEKISLTKIERNFCPSQNCYSFDTKSLIKVKAASWFAWLKVKGAIVSKKVAGIVLHSRRRSVVRHPMCYISGIGLLVHPRVSENSRF